MNNKWSKKKLRRQDDFRRRKTHYASLRATLRSRLRLGSSNRRVYGYAIAPPEPFASHIPHTSRANRPLWLD